MGYHELPRKTVFIDHRGRLTIPAYMLKAMKIEIPKGGNYPLDLELYPNVEEPKTIFIKKSWTRK